MFDSQAKSKLIAILNQPNFNIDWLIGPRDKSGKGGCWSAGKRPSLGKARRLGCVEVDPSNRLVAAELERRWEAALCKQREAEETLNRSRQDKLNRLGESDIAKIETLSHDIPALWHCSMASSIDKQTIVRTLIEEVSVGVVESNERIDVMIRWTGGYQSHL